MKHSDRWTFLIVFIAAVFSLTGSVFAERVSVSVNSANVRTGPDSSAEVAWEKLDLYYPLMVFDTKGDWHHVRDYENDAGWIHKSCIGKTESVIAKKDKCYVRSGPGRDNEIVFVVDNGVPFKVLKKKEKWIRIEHSDGDRGWIHESLVW